MKGLYRAAAAGERVFLRLPVPGDRAEFVTLRDANQNFLNRWWPREPDGTTMRGATIFPLLLRQNRSGRYRKYFVSLKSTGQIIGMINFNGLAPHPFFSTTLGYWISREYARQGLTTEAIGVALKHAFTSLKLHRVEANIMPSNKASLALIRKCGFRCEGLAKRYLQINGRWEDHQRWAMTVEDWSARERRRSTVNQRARTGHAPIRAARRSSRPS